MGLPLPADLSRALARYSGLLHRRFGARLRHVRLFGSWARGQARADSDVDVAVVVDDLSRSEWAAAIGDACDAEDAEGVILSPLVLSTRRFEHLVARQRRIARDVLSEGIAL